MDPVLFNDVWHHSVNRKGRDFIVGDLHGCVDALRYLLREIAFDPASDRLFSVGDLVDLMADWVPSKDDQYKVFVTNPHRLYGFPPAR